MKLCKDCKHVLISVAVFNAYCFKGRKFGIDYVYGGNAIDAAQTAVTCQSRRMSDDPNDCGKEARWFEPKDEKC